jgi:hypothetical protein
MHISTKNGTMVPLFAMELAQSLVTWQEVQENSCLEAPLCERVHLWTLGMPCLVFFPHATSKTMTACSIFLFFWIFLNTLAPLPDLAQTRAAFDVCQLGWEPKLCVGSRVPHPQGTSMYFFPIFWGCISCSPNAKLDLNRFRAKIIHYMAAGRDNS